MSLHSTRPASELAPEIAKAPRPRRGEAARAAAQDWLEAMPDLMRNQNVKFWTLQLGGFLGWGMASLATVCSGA